jgi:hypothetical protein
MGAAYASWPSQGEKSVKAKFYCERCGHVFREVTVHPQAEDVPVPCVMRDMTDEEVGDWNKPLRKKYRICGGRVASHLEPCPNCDPLVNGVEAITLDWIRKCRYKDGLGNPSDARGVGMKFSHTVKFQLNRQYEMHEFGMEIDDSEIPELENLSMTDRSRFMQGTLIQLALVFQVACGYLTTEDEAFKEPWRTASELKNVVPKGAVPDEPHLKSV